MIMSIINDLLCNNNSKGTMCVYVFFLADLQQDLWQLKISGFGAAYLPWDLFRFPPEGRTTHVWLSLAATDIKDICVAGSSASWGAHIRSIVVMIDGADDIAAIVNSVADASLVELVELVSVVVFVSLAFDPARHVFADLSWIIKWVRWMQDHLTSLLDDFGILGNRLADWEKRVGLLRIRKNSGVIWLDLMRDWVSEMWRHFVGSWAVVKMISDDVFDVLSGRDCTLSWSFLFSCILSWFNITLPQDNKKKSKFYWFNHLWLQKMVHFLIILLPFPLNLIMLLSFPNKIIWMNNRKSGINFDELTNK